MNLKKSILLSLFFALFIHLSAQFVGNGAGSTGTRSYLSDEAWMPREHNVDFIHMRLELSFDPSQGLVKGTAMHRFKPLREKVDSIWLDGPGIRVSAIRLNGKDVNWRTEEQGIWIRTGRSLNWNETDSMIISYEANPRKGLYFIGWNDPQKISRKQIWSQGQGIDNRYWIPFYDEMNDKLTTEMIVTFESTYKVLSNGVKLKQKENKDGTTTWHYRMNKPHAPYLVMLGIGIYDIKTSKSKSGVPINLYYYPEWKERVESTYRYSEQMVDFFEAETGIKYPWESYSQIPVQDFMYGAMENTTATVFGDFFFVDERGESDRSYVGVNAHELAHQWFGDYVTARSDAHHWLQESFATYYNMLFERTVFGQDYFDWQRMNAIRDALTESEKNMFPVAHSQGGTVRHYPKGAFVLNMLKNVAGGREAYNKAINYYLKKYPYGNVESNDLMVAFHECLGLSLDWFWDQWIYRGGEPSYAVTAADISSAGKRITRFTVEQVHKTDGITELFKMPIWFEVHYTDGTSESVQRWIEQKYHTIDITNANGKTIAYVLFDPNSEVMKSMTFERPLEWLKNQALTAKNMLDRYEAVVAMKTLSLTDRRETLLKVFSKETFHAVKSEVIAQLANDPDPATRAMLKSAIKSNDPLVQKAVISSMTVIPQELAADYESMLAARSYDVVQLALDKISLEFPVNSDRYLKSTEGVIGNSGRNVEIRRLEVAARNNLQADAIEKLISYAGESYEFRTRVNAAQALKRLDYFNETLMKHLVQAGFSSNSRLAKPCIEVLTHFYGQSRYRQIIRSYALAPGWDDWQREILNRIIAN